MNAPNRRRLLHAALVAFLAVDLLGLSSFAYSVLFGVDSPQVWLVASVPVLAMAPLLVRAADAVLTMAEDHEIIPMPGEKIP